MFNILVAANFRKWGQFQLVCDTNSNVIPSIAHYNNGADYTSTSGTVAHVLTQGQRAWLQFSYNAGSTQGLDEHVDYASNQFSGVLVHKN